MSVKRNAVWNMCGMGLPLLLAVFAIPYLYRHLGIEATGLLTLVWAVIGYFSLFDFGLGRALTQQVSVGLANRQYDSLPILIKSGLVLTALAGVFGAIVLAALSHPLGARWLHVSAPLQHAATAALLIAAFGVPITTVTAGLRGILEAYGDFAGINVLRLVLGLSNFGLPMLTVYWFGPSLPWIVTGLVIVRLVVLVGHWLLLNQHLPEQWHCVSASSLYVRQLFSFGAWITVSNIIGPLMVTADRFIIAGMLGAGVVAYYSVPSDMLSRLSIIPVAVTAALFPKLTAELITNPVAAYMLYRKSLLWVSVVMLPVCIAVAVSSRWGLSLWLGSDFAEHAWKLVAVLVVGVLFNGIALVPYSVIQASGYSVITAKLHAIELIFYVPMLVVSLHLFGLMGVVLTWVMRVAVDLALLLVCARKYVFAEFPSPNFG